MEKVDKKTGFRVQRCKKCKNGYPVVITVPGDLYYARCSNHECHAWDPWEFCGANRISAIEAWNRGQIRGVKPDELF